MPTENKAQNSPKHWQECTGAYDFLEQVRLRPGVWLPGGSLRHLESMLIGYRVALGVHRVEEDFDFWPENSFKEWLWRHLGRHSPLGWAAEIERETPAGSTPVAEFFRLLDTFRAEQDRLAAGRRSLTAPSAAEHPAMQVVRIEIERHDWDAMACGCGHPASGRPGRAELAVPGLNDAPPRRTPAAQPGPRRPPGRRAGSRQPAPQGTPSRGPGPAPCFSRSLGSRWPCSRWNTAATAFMRCHSTARGLNARSSTVWRIRAACRRASICSQSTGDRSAVAGGCSPAPASAAAPSSETCAMACWGWARWARSSVSGP
ncbi:hypothetical protein HS99_0008735 [Kitasatospora aureofaciens]|nr:hypothetical protein B6264_00035 [Kitasatospora aureofaciens]OEV34578.1 hypothetical protein HS99_0008735 [Kitasatospora aureofaciens]